MIIQINEQFHDHEEHTYFVDFDKLKEVALKGNLYKKQYYKNPVDALVLAAAKKKAFNQSVYIDVEAKREQEGEELWGECGADVGLSGKINVKLKSGQKPDKLVKLTISFD